MQAKSSGRVHWTYADVKAGVEENADCGSRMAKGGLRRKAGGLGRIGSEGGKGRKGRKRPKGRKGLGAAEPQPKGNLRFEI